MKITFLQEAQSEFLDAISCYEAGRPGLGQRFKDEVDRAVLWLADHPELCRFAAWRVPTYEPPHFSLLHPLRHKGNELVDTRRGARGA